jgi:hypothetical protein
VIRGRWSALLALSLAIVVVAIAASSWIARQRALEQLSFVDVSASTAARAMKDDHFYSDYGDKVIVIRGTVASVHNAGNEVVVSLQTDSSFGLTCTLTEPRTGTKPVVGDDISLVAPGGAAQRESSSVSLPLCRLMSRP